MKAYRILWALLLLPVMAGLTALVAQEKNPPAQHGYSYDVANQQTVEGNVIETRDYSCPVSGSVGSHIILKSDSGSIEVHLAPATFMKQYEIMIRKGDKARVTGSRIIFEGKPALIAKSIIIANDTYNFRDGKGRPLW
jgi:DNA/RNA endonuclease YhcR with UshA esterase domain